MLEPAWSVAIDGPPACRRHTFVTILVRSETGARLLAELCRTNATGRRVRAGWEADGRVHQIDLVADGDELDVRYRAPEA